jgi:hypothetical protein
LPMAYIIKDGARAVKRMCLDGFTEVKDSA